MVRIRDSFEYQMAKELVRDRDGNACVVCGSFKDVEVHHEVPIRVDRSRACDPSNMVCLCKEHHEEADAKNVIKYGA